ncbi:unnamed protein product [Sphenostylis stenocarpa]|uniref:Uncharacterized protein n=1 Tax=Sphenostylis stenocarpa TaxID=92480 RepID=A0AA86SP81_9FABA|nr:unnamed protein product [Sphenostylis stenocarpa]
MFSESERKRKREREKEGFVSLQSLVVRVKRCRSARSKLRSTHYNVGFGEWLVAVMYGIGRNTAWPFLYYFSSPSFPSTTRFPYRVAFLRPARENFITHINNTNMTRISKSWGAKNRLNKETV